jgi:hypothetical protein
MVPSIGTLALYRPLKRQITPMSKSCARRRFDV